MLRLATRAPGMGDPPSMRSVYRRGPQPIAQMTKARARVFDVITEYGEAPFTLKELSDLARVSSSVVKGLAKIGALLEEQTPKDRPFAPLDPALSGKPLTQAQATACDTIIALIRKDRFSTTLLRGITGSGKTEVYLEAVAECIRRGQQALVLLPEIALTAEFLKRVELYYQLQAKG